MKYKFIVRFINDFKKFIARGNLIDLAVGIMIGSSFNSIVKSLVDDILTPLLSVFLGKETFKTWSLEFIVPNATAEGSHKVILSYGKFLQASLDFLIMAFVIFFIVKALQSILEKAKDPKNKEIPTPKDIELLSEINDSLKAISNKDLRNE